MALMRVIPSLVPKLYGVLTRDAGIVKPSHLYGHGWGLFINLLFYLMGILMLVSKTIAKGSKIRRRSKYHPGIWYASDGGKAEK